MPRFDRDEPSRALHVLRASLRVFTQVEDVAELVDATCRIVIDIGECAAAWVGVRASERFDTVVGVGVDAREAARAVEMDPTGPDPAARAIATREPQLVSCGGEVPRLAAAGTVLALPLLDSRGVIGVLEVHAPADRPEAADVSIISELAENLAFAIAARIARAQLRETESQLQAALRESERIYRSLAEHLPDLVVRWDRDLNRVYVNPAFANTLNRPLEELMGTRLGEGYSAANRIALAPHMAALAASVRQVFATGVGISTEMVWPLDRGLGPYHLRLVPEYDEHGELMTVLGIGRDISALKRSERELRTLSDHSPDMIARYDRDARYLFVNRSIERATGKPASEWIGRTAGEVMGVDERGAQIPTYVPFVQLVTAACREGRPLESELVMPRDGAPHLFEVRLTPELDDLGRFESVLLVCRDITERRALEDRLRQAQKMEAVGQLAGGIAHDFNNMLAVILMQAALAVQPDASPAIVRSALETITETTERAAHLTTQLLTFSRRQVARLIEIDLRDIVAKVTNLLRRVLGDRIATEVRMRGAVPRVMADPVMIEQVLMNLGLNARDAMPEGGTLIVGVEPVAITEQLAAQGPGRRAGMHVCLSVSDCGVGIDPADLPRIFEPFFTTKDVSKGTGLGLATVFGIVQQHQGWIEVDSTVNRGTTFRVYIPAITTAQPRELPAGPPVQPPRRGANETILLVEDDRAVRRSVRAMLESYGYRVIEAESPAAASALWRTAANSIDLLLTDLIMPGPLTGLQLAEDLVGNQPSLKVIFMTGYGADMATKLLRVPGRIVLQKPFSADALAACVRNALDEAV